MEPSIASATVRREVKLPAYEDGKKLDYSGYEFEVSVSGADADSAIAEADRLSRNERDEYELRYGKAARAKPAGFSESQIRFLSEVAKKHPLPELKFLLGYDALKAAVVEKIGADKVKEISDPLFASMKK